MSDAQETPSTDNVVPLKNSEEQTVEVAQDLKEVAQDLKEKVGALSALAQVHHLLSQASYRVSIMMQVQQSLEFLSLLHGNMMGEALAHPDADKVPQLAEVKKSREGQIKLRDASKVEESTDGQP